MTSQVGLVRQLGRNKKRPESKQGLKASCPFRIKVEESQGDLGSSAGARVSTPAARLPAIIPSDGSRDKQLA